MFKLFCRLLGHDLKAGTSRKVRSCRRCGQVEALRRYGEVLAWEVVVNEEPLGGVAV